MASSSWPLSAAVARLLFVRTLELVQDEPCVQDEPLCAMRCLLCDPRLRQFHGREGAPRSLGSVLACFVAKCLPGSVSVVDLSNGSAVSSVLVRGDGALFFQPSSSIAQLVQFRLTDAPFVRNIVFDEPASCHHQVVPTMAVAPDGCVVIVRALDSSAVLVPQRVYETHERSVKCERSFESAALNTTICVCASNDAIAVVHCCTTGLGTCVSLFRRGGKLSWTTDHSSITPPAMCFDADGAHVLACQCVDSVKILGYSSVTGALAFVVPHAFVRVRSLAVSSWNELIVCVGGTVAIVPFAEARVTWHHQPSSVDGCAVSGNTLLCYRTETVRYDDEFRSGLAGLAFSD